MIFKKHTKPILIKNCKKKRKIYTIVTPFIKFLQRIVMIFNRMSFLNKKDTHGIRISMMRFFNSFLSKDDRKINFAIENVYN